MLGSTSTSPILPTVTRAREAASVTSHWPTPSRPPAASAPSATRGAPASVATCQPGAGRVTIHRLTAPATAITPAATAKVRSESPSTMGPRRSAVSPPTPTSRARRPRHPEARSGAAMRSGSSSGRSRAASEASERSSFSTSGSGVPDLSHR